jgi:hypothetical protein
LFLQAGSGRVLDLALQGLFQRPSGDLPKPERMLANLLALLQRLIDRELPALTRSMRVETTIVGTWTRTPQGGRVDGLASLRASAGAMPELWRVQRVDRNIDTPVNLFVAAVLRTTSARIEAVSALYRRHGLNVPDILNDTGVALRQFLREHPLGSVAIPADAVPGSYWRAAARRVAEIRRIGSLVQWWDELQKVDLIALHELFAVEGETLAELSIHSVYEMMVALGLVCALSLRLRSIASPDPEALRFAGHAVVVELRFGVRGPATKMRGFTASMKISSDSAPPATTLIDARNCSAASLPLYALYLEHACRQEACNGLLVAPEPAGAPEPGAVRWVAMPADSDVPSLIRRWLNVLALDPR